MDTVVLFIVVVVPLTVKLPAIVTVEPSSVTDELVNWLLVLSHFINAFALNAAKFLRLKLPVVVIVPPVKPPVAGVATEVTVPELFEYGKSPTKCLAAIVLPSSIAIITESTSKAVPSESVAWSINPPEAA